MYLLLRVSFLSSIEFTMCDARGIDHPDSFQFTIFSDRILKQSKAFILFLYRPVLDHHSRLKRKKLLLSDSFETLQLPLSRRLQRPMKQEKSARTPRAPAGDASPPAPPPVDSQQGQSHHQGWIGQTRRVQDEIGIARHASLADDQ